MKKSLILVVAILMLSATFVKAQVSTGDPELDYIRKQYSQDKKSIVDQYMKLDVTQGGKFWPIYADFETEQQTLANTRLQIISEYVDNADTLTDKVADRLATAILKNNIDLDKADAKYYDKVKKAIGALNAAKYMQLEVYLQTAWKVTIQENIPVIGQLDKTGTSAH
jgi:hypothetical protein